MKPSITESHAQHVGINNYENSWLPDQLHSIIYFDSLIAFGGVLEGTSVIGL